MKNYELIEHTADLAVRVWGADLKEIFVNSASAMYDLITDLTKVKPSVSIEIKADAKDRDELLRNWLSELLYYFHTNDILFSEFLIEQLDDKSIVSTARGEKIDVDRHNLKHDIKAVTFHNLKIEEEGSRLATDIIFDV